MAYLANLPEANTLPFSKLSLVKDVISFLTLACFFIALDLHIGLPAMYAGFISIIGAFLSVLLILHIRQQKIVGLGLKKPENLKTLPLWIIGILVITVGIAGGAQLLASQFIDGKVDLSKFAALHQNVPMLVMSLLSVWVTAAFFEEIVFRGFLLGRLIDIWGIGATGKAIAVITHAILFGALHAYQGPLGIVTTSVVAIVFGLFFVVLKRNLWALIIVHGLIDTMGIIQFFLLGLPS